jgi:CBS domain-containing protein
MIIGRIEMGVRMLVRAIVQQKGADVVTVEQTATVADAARALAEHRIGALVVAANGEEPAGIISERDIVRAVAEHGPEALELEVSRVMTTELATCTPDDGVDTLMATMTERRVRHLPVIDDGHLSGIVSIGDVVKHRVEELQVEARTLHDYIETGR